MCPATKAADDDLKLWGKIDHNEVSFLELSYRQIDILYSNKCKHKLPKKGFGIMSLLIKLIL